MESEFKAVIKLFQWVNNGERFYDNISERLFIKSYHDLLGRNFATDVETGELVIFEDDKPVVVIKQAYTQPCTRKVSQSIKAESGVHNNRHSNHNTDLDYVELFLENFN